MSLMTVSAASIARIAASGLNAQARGQWQRPKAIADRPYPVSRPLFICDTTQKISAVVGLQKFCDLAMSDDMVGHENTLARNGVPFDPDLPMTQSAEQLGSLIEPLT